MKILHVITKSNWGGAQKYVYDLATNLPKEHFESVVIFGGTGPLAEKLAEKNVRTISIPNLSRNINPFVDILSFFKLVKIFRLEKPDVVHVNSSKIGGLGALASRMTGVRHIIFTCHGWAWNEDRGSMSLTLIKLISWLTVILSHTTITISERDFSDGQNILWSKNKIKFVHNGINSPEFMEKIASRSFITDLSNKKGISIGENDFLIGAIGELHKNKDYKHALEAIFILKQKKIPAKFVIMGEGEEKDELESITKNLRLEKDVVFLGFIKNAPKYLRAFDSFILTSIKEGLPYVVIEAGFASLPVVTTNVGGVREIIEDMKSGVLVQTRKPDEVASGLELIYNNADRALLFGQNLKEKVEHDFSLSKMIEKTIEIYKG